MTISEIARLAKLSTATISRVINNKGTVKPATEKKVREVIARYNFQPSAMARALSNRKTGQIGLIADDVTNVFYKEIVVGAQEVCLHEGYNLLMANAYSSITQRRKVIEYFLQGAVDGLILTESDVYDDTYLKNLAKSKTPFVLIEDCIENSEIPSITTDNVKIGYLATKHLLSLNHKKIAHISGNINFKISRQRIEGFQSALSEAGITPDPKYIVYADFNWKTGYEAMLKLLNLSNRPTAVFSANDAMAYAAIKAANDTGLIVPQDISIIGVDGIRFMNENYQYLTTIQQPMIDYGRRSAEILINKVHGVPLVNSHIVLETSLLLGQTTAPCSND